MVATKRGRRAILDAAREASAQGDRELAARLFARAGISYVPSRAIQGTQRVLHAAKKKPRLSHATKATKKRSDKINIDQLAEMFDLPSWERIDEMNQQHYWEVSKDAGDEEAQLEAERAAQDDVYAQWYDAVERAASQLFEQFNLELQPAGKWHPSTYSKTKTERRPHQLKIVPSKSWDDAADKIRRTMSGVGYFSYDTLPEFLKSGPYTARTAVLSHLKTIADYPEVYGSTSARRLYEAAW